MFQRALNLIFTLCSGMHGRSRGHYVVTGAIQSQAKMICFIDLTVKYVEICIRDMTYVYYYCQIHLCF